MTEKYHRRRGINKFASNFVENEDANKDNVGHKWSLSALNKHLLCCNVDVRLIWSRIIDVIIKTILAVERPIVNKMKGKFRICVGYVLGDANLI